MKWLSKVSGKASLMKQHMAQGSVLQSSVNISISVLVNYTLEHKAHLQEIFKEP